MTGLLRTVGGRLRRLAGGAPDPVTDGRVGGVVVLAMLASALWLPLGVVVGAAGAFGPRWQDRRARRQQSERVVSELPEVVDLFVLGVGAGLTVPLAVAAVAKRSDGRIGTALGNAAGWAALGQPMSDALAAIPSELGPALRPLIGSLTASERYGTPLLPELERLAVEARHLRRRQAEVAARRLPVQLLFPLVLCTLPAFAVLTVVPFLVATFGSLRL